MTRCQLAIQSVSTLYILLNFRQKCLKRKSLKRPYLTHNCFALKLQGDPAVEWLHTLSYGEKDGGLYDGFGKPAAGILALLNQH